MVVEFGGLLHLFHRDAGDEVRHWVSADGEAWADRGAVGLAGDEPVATAAGGRLFVLFRGLDDPGRIEVSSTDGDGWEVVRRIGFGESVRTSTRPAVAEFRGRLHVFFRGEAAAGTVFSVSTANGRQWRRPVNLTEATRGARAAGAPFPVAFDGRLVVLMRDPASSGIAVSESCDGVRWSTVAVLAGSESEERPVAVVHRSRLFVFFQTYGGLLGVVSRTPGGPWCAAEVIPKAVHWPPVPVPLAGRLVVLARDYLDPRSVAVIGAACDLVQAAPGRPGSDSAGFDSSAIGWSGLDGTSLDGTRFGGTSLNGTSLDRTSPDGMGFGGAGLGGACFGGASLGGERFEGVSFEDVGSHGALFEGVRSEGVGLPAALGDVVGVPSVAVSGRRATVAFRSGGGVVSSVVLTESGSETRGAAVVGITGGTPGW